MNGLTAAITQKKPFAHAHLATSCVPTEVIVIVQYQNACRRIEPAKVMGRRKAADSGADHDQIHFTFGRELLKRKALAVTQRMRRCIRGVRTAAHPSERRRIHRSVSRCVQPPRGSEPCADRNSDAIQKITPSDSFPHESSG